MEQSPRKLWRIVAPHYVAGLIVSGGVVVEAAPILGWSVGKEWRGVRRYLRGKGYRGELL